MKPLIGLIALLFTTGAFAQTAPPKASKKPAARAKLAAQPKPLAPMGCKLVGTVRGIRIWAGDCVAMTPPAAETPAPADAASPPDENQ